MIIRRLQTSLEARLAQFPAVALLGPRQVGKTTLARSVAGQSDNIYLDLENPVDIEKLSDARGYLAAQDGKLVVIDEIQRAPQLFQVLRGLIDERVLRNQLAGQFFCSALPRSTC